MSTEKRSNSHCKLLNKCLSTKDKVKKKGERMTEPSCFKSSCCCEALTVCIWACVNGSIVWNIYAESSEAAAPYFTRLNHLSTFRKYVFRLFQSCLPPLLADLELPLAGHGQQTLHCKRNPAPRQNEKKKQGHLIPWTIKEMYKMSI